MKIAPFGNDYTFKHLGDLIRRVQEEILGLDNEYVLKASQTELETYYTATSTVQPITLYPDEYCIESRESVLIEITNDPRRGVSRGQRVSIPGTILTIAIPYEGDSNLWQCKPSVFSLRPFPEIELMQDRIVFQKTFPDDTASSQQLKSEIGGAVKAIADAIDNLRKDVEKHNDSVSSQVKDILNRKRKLAESAIGAVSGSGIPIKRRDTPLTFGAPVSRRKSPVKKPGVVTEGYQKRCMKRW